MLSEQSPQNTKGSTGSLKLYSTEIYLEANLFLLNSRGQNRETRCHTLGEFQRVSRSWRTINFPALWKELQNCTPHPLPRVAESLGLGPQGMSQLTVSLFLSLLPSPPPTSFHLYLIKPTAQGRESLHHYSVSNSHSTVLESNRAGSPF